MQYHFLTRTLRAGALGLLLLVRLAHAQINPAHPATLRAGIVTAAQKGTARIVVPPGIYHIPASTTGANLEFADLKDLVIDATGATFLFDDNTKTGLYFRNCRNVTLRGAIVRNATLPFTQGTIESIADDRKSWVLKIDDGYPTTLDNGTFFDPRTTYYVFDRHTRRLNNDTYDYGTTGVERLDAHRFRVTFGGPLNSEVTVGDLTAMRGRGGSGVHSDHCARMRFENVSVQYAGGFGWFETDGAGDNVYIGIQAKPGPKPNGATSEPLLSENADGFHSASVAKGPTIENSAFTRMPDDGIAIHGEYQMVRQVNGNTLICMRPWGGVPYTVGSHVAWVKKDGVPGGEALVTAIKALPDGFLPPVQTEFRHFQDNRCFFQITLDHSLDAHEGDVVSNLDQSGSGYILRGNTIVNHRARGLLLKARDGLVENNLIDGSSIAGIVIGPELWWGEANYSENVIVRGNTIARCGYATTGPWNEQAGALTVLGTGDSPVALGHKNLLIESNTFADNDGVNVVLDGVDTMTFRNNRFVGAQQRPNRRGSDRGIDTGALIWINRARNVTIAGNVVERLGSANSSQATVTKNGRGISDLGRGIRIVPDTKAQVTAPFDFQYSDNEGVMRREVRDPAIIRDGDTYYLTFTMWPFANREDKRMALPNNGSSPGIRLFSSKDLKMWTPGPWLVRSSDLPQNSPYKHRFWAPEIHKFNGKFYLIFTADNWLKPAYNPAGNWGAAGYAFVGVADRVTGPYRHITYLPGGACDTTLAQDTDGTIYAVMPKYDIFARPLDLSKLDQGKVSWLGPEKKIVSCKSDDTVLGTDPNYLEGPWVQRIGNKFVMFYAETFETGYWTGAAYANSLAGPWHKDPRGLIFWGGHTALFDGPDARTWVSYRVEDRDGKRGLPAAVPLILGSDGSVLVTPFPTPP